MDLTATLLAAVPVALALGFANWRGRRPAEPGRVRLVPWLAVQFLALVILVTLLVHALVLLGVRPPTR